MSRGYSVRVFLPFGEPQGLRIVRKSNWTGIGIVFPRTRFAQAARREELQQSGVYVLWELSGPEQPTPVYIGESDQLVNRLKTHNSNAANSWTHAVAFTGMNDQILHKAHVRYLEWKMLKIASESVRCTLQNSVSPTEPNLPEEDRVDAELYLADMMLCLPTVGVDFIITITGSDTSQKSFSLKSEGKHVAATGYEGVSGFVVLSGSTVAKDSVSSAPDSLKRKRSELLRDGILVDKGDFYQFSKDFVFSSPSGASSVVLGGNSNGRMVWKDADGRSLNDLANLDSFE